MNQWTGTFKSYFYGFIISLILTIMAYVLVSKQLLSKGPLILSIVTLGCLQALAQLYFFLHLGKEGHPRWGGLIFCFMVIVLLIIVFGSLWIMFSLDARMM